MVLSRPRALLYAGYALLLTVAGGVSLHSLDEPRAVVPLLLAYGLGALIPAVTVLRREIDLLEPIYAFSLMYYLFFIGALYFIHTDFQYSQHLLIQDNAERYRTLTVALVLVLVGYVAFLAGYAFFWRNRGRARIEYGREPGLPIWMVTGVVLILLSLGVGNFVVDTMQYPGGTLAYYRDIGARQHRLEFLGDQISTIGYNLVYAATLIWAYVAFRGDAPRGARTLFVTGAILALTVMGAQGRVMQTLSFALVLLGLAYASVTGVRRNLRYVAVWIAAFVAGVLAFVLRLLSTLAYNNPGVLLQSPLLEIVRAAGESLLYVIIGKGNVPNLPVLMNILELWSAESGPMYGSTLVYWIRGFTPQDDGAGIGGMLGDMWGTTVGGLPPTFIGELYINFSYLGVPVGMLVLGALLSAGYGFVARRGSFWVYLVYLGLLFRFVLVLPKGEFFNLAGAIWLFLPTLAIVGAMSVLCLLVRRAKWAGHQPWRDTSTRAAAS